jgi:hypothetical protein
LANEALRPKFDDNEGGYKNQNLGENWTDKIHNVGYFPQPLKARYHGTQDGAAQDRPFKAADATQHNGKERLNQETYAQVGGQ